MSINQMHLNVSKNFYQGKDLYVGIDMHKKRWVVTIRTRDLELRTFSANPSAAKLLEHLQRNYSGAIFHLVYEAGCFGYVAYDYFRSHGINIIVTPPNRIPQEQHRRVKTDRIDSRALAKQLAKSNLKKVIVPEPFFREARHLFRLFDQQKRKLRRIKCQIRQILLYHNHPLQNENWSKRFIAQLKELRFSSVSFTRQFQQLIRELEFYEELILETKRDIRSLAKESGLQERIERFARIKGVGYESATRLVIFLFDQPQRYRSAEGISHYVGLTPSENSSGERVRRGAITGEGDRVLRSLLIQISWRVIRWDPVLLEKYENVLQRCGLKQKAIVAVARKLLVRLATIQQKRQDYHIGYIQ